MLAPKAGSWIAGRRDYLIDNGKLYIIHGLARNAGAPLTLDKHHLLIASTADASLLSPLRFKTIAAPLRKESDVCRPRDAGVSRPKAEFGFPSAAEAILSFVCPPDREEALLGDLKQNYRRHVERYGEKAAQRWYLWQTARTLVKFGLEFATKVALLVALLKHLKL